MKLKKWIGQGWKAMLWLLALAVCLLALERAMRLPDGEQKYGAFFEETEPIDVFFLGTSHVMDAVYPMELWRQAGISSYNLGNPSETLEASYWTLRLALETHTPQAVLIDVCYIDREQSAVSNYALSHLFLDETPFSREKLAAIWALFPEGARAEFVFPLIFSHSRWEEIAAGAQATTDCVPCMKGAELRVGRSEPAPFVRTAEMDLTETAGKQALRDILALCEEKGIAAMLMAIPYPAEESRQMMMNSAQRIADEYGVPFLNLFDVEGLVDFETDCYDEMSHLNPDGALKISRYLTGALTDRLALEDRRDDPAYADWNEALAEYEQLLQARWADESLLPEFADPNQNGQR